MHNFIWLSSFLWVKKNPIRATIKSDPNFDTAFFWRVQKCTYIHFDSESQEHYFFLQQWGMILVVVTGCTAPDGTCSVPSGGTSSGSDCSEGEECEVCGCPDDEEPEVDSAPITVPSLLHLLQMLVCFRLFSG